MFACADRNPTSSPNQACTSCVESMCAAEATSAYGSGYTSGNYGGGACGSYVNCVAKCTCNDLTCFENCGPPSTACNNALMAGQSCGSQKCSSQCGPTTVGGSGDDGGTVVVLPSTDASAGGGGPTGACNMGSSNICISGIDVNTCSAAGGTLMSTCPSAGLAGCCTSSGIETCFYSPLTASDAMAACKNGTFSTAP